MAWVGFEQNRTSDNGKIIKIQTVNRLETKYNRSSKGYSVSVQEELRQRLVANRLRSKGIPIELNSIDRIDFSRMTRASFIRNLGWA